MQRQIVAFLAVMNIKFIKKIQIFFIFDVTNEFEVLLIHKTRK